MDEKAAARVLDSNGDIGREEFIKFAQVSQAVDVVQFTPGG